MPIGSFRTHDLNYGKSDHVFSVNRKSVGGDCEVLLADTHHGDSSRLLYIYKRWVTSIYTIKGWVLKTSKLERD